MLFIYQGTSSGMPFRKKPRAVIPSRPFYGRTNRNRIQTLDYGSGAGEYLKRQKQNNPARNYAVVDQLYASGNALEKRARELESHGIRVSPSIEELIHELRAEGTKVRHFNIDMPYGLQFAHGHDKKVHFFHSILEAIPKVLLPNGKLWITTESHSNLEELAKMAKVAGLKVRELKSFDKEKFPRMQLRTETMRNTKYSVIYRLEITYGLKKAIPRKYDRINLHGNKPKKK